METNQPIIIEPATSTPQAFMPPANLKSPNEPNQRFMRNSRPNYFRRQEKKNGKDWIDKVYNHLDKDIPMIVRDFIEGNVTDADVMYLFNSKFWYKISNAVYDRMTKSYFRVEANKVYAEFLLKQTRTVPQYFIGLRNADENEYYVWKEFQAFLENFSTISRSVDGANQAVKYTLASFIPNLARYRGIML